MPRHFRTDYCSQLHAVKAYAYLITIRGSAAPLLLTVWQIENDSMIKFDRQRRVSTKLGRKAGKIETLLTRIHDDNRSLNQLKQLEK